MKQNSKTYLIIALCLASSCSIGMFMSCLGVFFTPVAESLSVKRGDVAIFYTIMAFASAIFSIIVSLKANNKNYKKIYIGGVIGSICSLILLANASNLVMLYIGGLLLGAFFSAYYMTMMTSVINCSFDKNIGTITGLIFSISGLASAILLPLFSAIISSRGWHIAFYVMAGIALLLCLPAVFVEMKVEKENADEENASVSHFNIFSPDFICMILMSLLFMFLPAMTQHFPGFASSRSLDLSLGSLLASSSMIGSIAFKLIAGVMTDKLGVNKATCILCFITLLGTLILLINSNTTLLLVAAFLFGAIYGITNVLGAYRTRLLYGLENYKKAFSLIALAGNASNALSIAAIGYIFDYTSSYDLALILAMIFTVIGFILSILADRIVKKSKKEYTD